MKKLLLAVAMVVVTGLALVAPAMAKLSITSQELPASTTVEEPFEVRFTVEAHESVTAKVSDMAVTAMNSSTGEGATFAATLAGDTWLAVVNLPSAGTWEMFATSETAGFRQPLGMTETSVGAAALATSRQVTSGLAELRADLEQQIADLKAEQDVLTKQIQSGDSSVEFDERLSNLALEVDQLNKEMADLGTAGAAGTSNPSPSWWITALVASGATALLLAGAAYLAARRGMLDTLVPEAGPASG